jgi:hypothetical protein
MDFKFDPNENEGKIPYLATIYEPREDEKINELLNKPTRRIYYIPLEDYREEEKEKLIEYYEFCLTKNYKIKTDIKGCKYYYPNIFRQLQGSDFDIEKSFDEIRKEINFKIEKFPIVYNDIYKEIFNTGCIYIHGRDNAYRPLIIFNPGMLNSLNHQ